MYILQTIILVTEDAFNFPHKPMVIVDDSADQSSLTKSQFINTNYNNNNKNNIADTFTIGIGSRRMSRDKDQMIGEDKDRVIFVDTHSDLPLVVDRLLEMIAKEHSKG